MNALTVFVSDFPSGNPPSRGFADRLEEVCPDTCSSKDLEIAVTDIGTTLPLKVSSELQRDPNINYIFFISGSFASGVARAIVELGMQDDVIMIGHALVPAEAPHQDNHSEPVEFTGPEGYEDMSIQMWCLG